MKLYQVYFLEFSFRLFYILISYFICLIIFFLNIDTIFLFETNSLLTILTTKRLILTKISQLFNTIWFLCNSFSFSFLFPLIFYHILYFFKSGWYKYQVRILKTFYFFYINIFLVLYFFSHIIIITSLINFFLYWEIKEISSLLRIEAEISLFYYILWNFHLKFFFSYCLINFLFLIYLTLKFFNIFILYKLFLKLKKLIMYLFICNLFILIPPDFFFQILIVIISYFLFELFFLIICIKTYIKINF